MILAFIALPILLAGACALGRVAQGLRIAALFRFLVMGNATVFLAGAIALIAGVDPLFATPSWLTHFVRADALSIYFFAIMAVVNFCACLYSMGYLSREASEPKSEAGYAIALLFFDAAMAGVLFSNHLALLWTFLEATTLAGAFLVNYERGKASLEATWKYLFICSIGIALAFVSIVLVAYAWGPSPSLFIDELYAHGGKFDTVWLKVALAFALVGFGTKVGLAPMHAWLPDAHSEAPSPVSALLSGALLNAALLPLLRLLHLADLSGIGREARIVFIAMGFLSVLVCAVFSMRVGNYKRLLAYSSIENMGIIAIGAGIGGIGTIAALVHVAAHSFSKASLFMTAGNIYGIFHTKKVDAVRGLAKVNKLTAWIWLLSFVAISGIPPFPSFISKFLSIKSMFDQGMWWLAPLFLLLVVAILAGQGKAFFGMAFSNPVEGSIPKEAPATIMEKFCSYAPQLILLALLLALSLGFFGPIQSLLTEGAACL